MIRALIPVCIGMLLAANAIAQGYPLRPVRIVIPLSSGGTTDVPGRIIAQRLSDVQQLLVASGMEATPTTSEEFGAYLKSEYDKWGRVVRESGATVN